MKSFKTLADALCVAVICLLAPEATARAPSPQFMKTGGFLAISAVLGVVVLWLLIQRGAASFFQANG